MYSPQIADPSAFASELAGALEAGDVAALLLRLVEADERTMINRAKAVAGMMQRRGIALILDGHPEMTARAGADGAHLTGIEALTAAVPLLKPDRIAGCGGLRSRHDAMLAGEASADYVMFGEPDRRGGRPSFEMIEERVSWWVELFEPPCIGYAADLDEVAAFAQAGADFVALGDWIWTHPNGPAVTIEMAMARLCASSSATRSKAGAD